MKKEGFEVAVAADGDEATGNAGNLRLMEGAFAAGGFQIAQTGLRDARTQAVGNQCLFDLYLGAVGRTGDLNQAWAACSTGLDAFAATDTGPTAPGIRPADTNVASIRVKHWMLPVSGSLS